MNAGVAVMRAPAFWHKRRKTVIRNERNKSTRHGRHISTSCIIASKNYFNDIVEFVYADAW